MLNFLNTLSAVKINPNDIHYKNHATDITPLLNTVYLVAGIVAVCALIYAGFLYTTSNGKPEQTKRARNMIFGVVIGLVIILGAFAITNFITGRF